MWNFIRRRWYLGLAALCLLVLIPSAVLYGRSVRMVDEFAANRTLQAALIYDRNGQLIDRLGQQGEMVSLDEVPEHLKQAVVAVEDARFYRHRGVDLVGVLRAFWANLRSGERSQGASTITMQLARNIFLYPDKTWSRKIQEAALALALESRYSKDEILEMYLNQIYFGEGAYGVAAASQIYFNKPVSELDLAESALIAGLPQAPSAYSPYAHLERARERRSVVLQRMVAVGAIDQTEADRAKDQRISLRRRTGGPARYFVDWLTNVLIAELGETAVFQGGLKVHTTLDLGYQKAAEDALGGQNNQGALVALDPHTGGILAMVGGRDYRQSQFNRAAQARRQPGSAMKPIIYAAALKEGMQVNTLVDDTRRSYDGYQPRNYDDQYWGRLTMKHAIAMSLNSAAVWTLHEIGVDTAV
ncbi:MAG: transglycosylase domain-containing protein, partial [Limnochordia bacterium]